MNQTQKITVPAFTEDQWAYVDETRVRPSVHQGELSGQQVELLVFQPLDQDERGKHKMRCRGYTYFVHPEASVEGMSEAERMDHEVRCFEQSFTVQWNGALCIFVDEKGDITSCYRLVEINEGNWSTPSWQKVELEVV